MILKIIDFLIHLIGIIFDEVSIFTRKKNQFPQCSIFFSVSPPYIPTIQSPTDTSNFFQVDETELFNNVHSIDLFIMN